MFGAPAGACTVFGNWAGSDSRYVRPISPGKWKSGRGNTSGVAFAGLVDGLVSEFVLSVFVAMVPLPSNCPSSSLVLDAAMSLGFPGPTMGLWTDARARPLPRPVLREPMTGRVRVAAAQRRGRREARATSACGIKVSKVADCFWPLAVL